MPERRADRAAVALAIVLGLLSVAIAQEPNAPPAELPATATQQLVTSLAAAKPHQKHIWRDTAPLNADGTVNGYIEISRGDRRKWEFDMVRNDRALDRVIPESIGGYPVNYGFVPQTISYDGDPFDVLVLGPAIPGGRLVKGVIVGLMLMEDEKGWDAKVVISRVAADGSALHQLSAREQDEIASYFRRYRAHEPGKFSKVPGWGSREAGLAYVNVTHAFFRECRTQTTAPCRVRR
jgi:inorganic pyrophosphatase